jgi:flagellar biogenesis protein FliO
VFDKKTKLKAKKFKSKEKKQEKTTARTQPSAIGTRIFMFLAVIAALGFVLAIYVPM